MATTLTGKNVATDKSGHTAPGPPAVSMIPPVAPPTPTGVPSPFLYVAKSSTAKGTSSNFIAGGGKVLTKGSYMDIETPGNQPSGTLPIKDLVSHAHVKKAKMMTASGTAKVTAGDDGIVVTGDQVKLNVLTKDLELCQSIAPLLDGAGFTAACADPTNAGVDIITLAEPVAVAGGVVVESATDFQLPGLIPVEWGRSYASSRYKLRGLLGRGGWLLSIEQHIEVRDDVIVFHLQGAEHVFPRPVRDAVSFLRSHRLELTAHADEGWAVRFVDSGFVHELRPVARGERAVLHRVVDTYGNHVDVQWEGSNPIRLVDTAKRELALHYDEHGWLERVDVWARGSLARSVTYGYDEDGCLASVEDAEGHVERYLYDGLHRLTTKRRRNGVAFHYRYDRDVNRCVESFGDGGIHHYEFIHDAVKRTTIAHGNSMPRAFEYDARGSITRAATLDGAVAQKDVFDPDGYVVERSDAAGRAERFTWNDRGKLVQYEDPAGGILKFHYENDLPTQHTFPNATAVTFDWNDRGALTGITSAGGRKETLVYDGYGRLCGVYGPEGTLHTWEWDDEHNVAREVDGAGHIVEYTYDGVGNILSRTEVAGSERSTTQSEWDRLGHRTVIRYADGRSLRFEYDGLGCVTRVVDHLGRASTMKYAGVGRLVELVTPAGERFTLEYDDNELVRRIVNPRREVHEYKYDRAGRIVETRTFDGRVIKTHYNRANLVSRVEHDDETFVAWTYDVRGLVLTETTPESKSTYERDEFGVLKRSIVEEGGDEIVSTIDHDALGRPVRLQQGDHVITYAYDDRGRTVERTIDGAVTTRYAYGVDGAVTAIEHRGARYELRRDAFGLERERRLPCGTSIHFAYDVVHRMIDQSVVRGAPLPNGETILARRRWSFGPDNLPARIDDTRWGTTEYAHDVAGRLERASNGNFVERIVHDAGGPRVLQRNDDAESWIMRMGDVLVRTAHAQLDVDARRRRVRAVPIVGGQAVESRATSYTWDIHDRLREVVLADGTQILFSYDAAGRRARKRVIPPPAADPLSPPPPAREVHYLWESDALIAEYDSEHGPRVFVHEPNTLVPVLQDERGEIFSYVVDHLGVVRELIDPRGRVAWAGTTTAYGVPLHAEVDPGALLTRTRPAEPAFRNLGQYRDEDVDLAATRHRWFDPRTARFLTPDPAGLIGGFDAFAFEANPTYAVDPLGLAAVGPNGTCNGFGYIRFRTSNGQPDGEPQGVTAAITKRMLGTGTLADRGIRPRGFDDLAAATAGMKGLHNAARGHLLARCLGGPGDLDANLVTLYQRPVNTPRMSGVEVSIRNAIRDGPNGTVVNYDVTPNYGPGGPGNGAPSSVTITATSGGSSVLPPTSGGQTVNQTGGSTVLANEPAGGFSSP